MFFFSSRRRHTRCALVTGVQTCALPISRVTATDRRKGKSLATFNEEWVGTDTDALAATSPNRLVDRIRVPVFFAAGGEDEIAPIEQSHKMEAALKGAGVPVESLYYSTEGHGFYVQAHRIEFYQRLLGFLRTEEHTSELQSLMRISYAVFCLKKK